MTQRMFSKKRKKAEEIGRGDWLRRKRKFKEMDTYESKCIKPWTFRKIFWKFLKGKELRKLRNVEVLFSWNAWDLWRTWKFVKWGENDFPQGFILRVKMSGSNPAQNSKRKISRWICALLLNLGNEVPPGAINGALQVSKCQWQL